MLLPHSLHSSLPWTPLITPSRSELFPSTKRYHLAKRIARSHCVVAAAGATATSPLRVMPTTNGPCLIEGWFTLVSSDGATRTACGPKTAFCRCGHSRNKPFCDGSHVRVGFRDIWTTLSPRPLGGDIAQPTEPIIKQSGRASSG